MKWYKSNQAASVLSYFAPFLFTLPAILGSPYTQVTLGNTVVEGAIEVDETRLRIKAGPFLGW